MYFAYFVMVLIYRMKEVEIACLVQMFPEKNLESEEDLHLASPTKVTARVWELHKASS